MFILVFNAPFLHYLLKHANMKLFWKLLDSKKNGSIIITKWFLSARYQKEIMK